MLSSRPRPRATVCVAIVAALACPSCYAARSHMTDSRFRALVGGAPRQRGSLDGRVAARVDSERACVGEDHALGSLEALCNASVQTTRDVRAPERMHVALPWRALGAKLVASIGWPSVARSHRIRLARVPWHAQNRSLVGGSCAYGPIGGSWATGLISYTSRALNGCTSGELLRGHLLFRRRAPCFPGPVQKCASLVSRLFGGPAPSCRPSQVVQVAPGHALHRRSTVGCWKGH